MDKLNLSPINEIDYARFMKLGHLVNKNRDLRSKLSPGTSPEIKIYVSSQPSEKLSYVSIEIRGYIPLEDSETIFHQTVEQLTA